MNILLVNDDGIEARGLALLARVMAEHGRLFVVAPQTEQSAIGHGITIHNPIRVLERTGLFPGETRAWGLEAKPADCVKFALYALDLPVDLVVSGVNDGPNMGTDIVYSGTLAGASEAVICGKPAIAVSTDFGFFDLAERELSGIMAAILSSEVLSRDNVLNVNFPIRGFGRSLGIRVCNMGDRPFLHEFVEKDGEYWARGTWGEGNNPPGTDVWAFRNGYVSVTPIQVNRTNYSYMQVLRERLPGAS
ncbi:MAG TPA: 5'/3'-nucleotidase SurE [Magnetospirillaceae bacterium]|nr:5'/3'-nucleotidase SurE [Magnetospirillaceae bacterium]